MQNPNTSMAKETANQIKQEQDSQ